MSGSPNQQLRQLFDELANALDLLGESSFKSASHRRVARALGELNAPITDLAENPEKLNARLLEIPGIGRGAARRISEFVSTGEMSDHRRALEKVPPGLLRVLEIPGLGPKAVRTLWTEAGVENLDDLQRELESGTIAKLPGMGPKTAANIQQAVAFAAKTQGRLPIGIAQPLAEAILETLRAAAPEARVEIAGSLRRGRDTIGDLDFLAACDSDVERGALRRAFVQHEYVDRVLADGAKKSSVWLTISARAVQADLRLVDPSHFGAAWHYFSGSREHNILMRQVAIASGMKLNEYGLFEGEDLRAASQEAELFSTLGLPFIPPELREEAFDPAVIGLERLREILDSLIEEHDIRCDLHVHSTASDGRHTLEELVGIARRRGLEALAVTDHSRSSALAGGLEIDALLAHVERIRQLDREAKDVRLLAGAEVDILADGTLDYPDEVLDQLDVVVASPHAALNQESDKATRRLLRAVRHPHVHVLGHPTGRQVARRRGLEPDLDAVFAAARECNTALELNANPRRLDLSDSAVRGALEAGCNIAINTDAHRDSQFDYLTCGVQCGRRAGLSRERCVNTWDSGKLLTWLRSKTKGTQHS